MNASITTQAMEQVLGRDGYIEVDDQGHGITYGPMYRTCNGYIQVRMDPSSLWSPYLGSVSDLERWIDSGN